MNILKKILLSLIIFFAAAFCNDQSINRNDEWKNLDKILTQIKLPQIPSAQFKLTDFGPLDEIKTNIKPFIDEAVKQCSSVGGGKIIVPKGEYFSKGPIHLKSNIHLHFEDGVIIRFSNNPSDYLPVVFTRWEGVECYNYSSLIYAYEQENIAITGNAILDGQADNQNWWPWKGKTEYGFKIGMPSQLDQNARARLFKLDEEQVDVSKRIFGEGFYLRPNFLQLYKCKNILLSDIKFINSPMWVIHPVLCESVTIKNVKTVSHGPNSDGCNPESSRNVLIEDCYFDNGDDCIAIKSGRNFDGRRIAVPSENIIIRNCVMKDGHGGVVIGSEVSGGCRNVFAENCKMDSPNLDRMLRIKSNSLRGGFVENIFVRNIEVGTVSNAIFLIELLYEMKENEKGSYPPAVRNIRVENVKSQKSEYALQLIGLDNPKIEGIIISDCEFNNVEKGNYIQNVKSISLNNVRINGELIHEIK
jgi:polygalacturonase